MRVPRLVPSLVQLHIYLYDRPEADKEVGGGDCVGVVPSRESKHDWVIIETSLNYHRNIIDLSLTHHRSIMETSLKYHRHIIELPSTHH